MTIHLNFRCILLKFVEIIVFSASAPLSACFQPWMVLVSTMTRVDKQKKRKLIADYSDDQFIVEIIYQSEMSNIC